MFAPANGPITQEWVAQQANYWGFNDSGLLSKIKDSLCEDAEIWFYSCGAANSNDRRISLKLLAKATGAKVVAAKSCWTKTSPSVLATWANGGAYTETFYTTQSPGGSLLMFYPDGSTVNMGHLNYTHSSSSSVISYTATFSP